MGNKAQAVLDEIEALSSDGSIPTIDLIDLYEEIIGDLESRVAALRDDINRPTE